RPYARWRCRASPCGPSPENWAWRAIPCANMSADPPKPLPVRPVRQSWIPTLDPYKEQIRQWIEQDHLYNCQPMYRRLRAQGSAGRQSILKDFVRPFRPVVRRTCRPVIRYETAPGEQRPFDWGELVYEQEGQTRKLFGFTAVLSSARRRLVIFVKRTDAPTL